MLNWPQWKDKMRIQSSCIGKPWGLISYAIDLHKLWRDNINEGQSILRLTYDLVMDTTP